jgi:HD-like signal output (HDOD) protein
MEAEGEKGGSGRVCRGCRAWEKPMWNKLTGFARRNKAEGSESRLREARSGNTTIAIETAREVLTARRLERTFCAELLGVNSFINSVNPLERRVMKRVDRVSGKGADIAALVPRVPKAVPGLMQSFSDATRSGDQLAAEISRDAVLLGNVLRFANSPFYASREPITGIEHALALLGRDGLRALTARAVFRPLLKGHTDHFSKLAGPRLWQQAEHCAVACEYLARRNAMPVFDAFVAGLIHRAGYRVVARVLGEEYQGGDAPRSAVFRDWLIERMPVLSWRVAREWGLPVSVTESLKGLGQAESGVASPRLTGIVFAAARLSELFVLSRTGRIRGEIKRFSCRINGELADCCGLCYAEMSKLDEPV